MRENSADCSPDAPAFFVDAFSIWLLNWQK
jgi:hypothetical protein